MKNSFLLLSRLRSVLLALTLMIGCSFAFAQTKTISGVVTGSGFPLPGVNVKVKGGSAGAVTDFDGIYKIDANIGEVLEFSSLGFKTQDVVVASDSKIDIILLEDITALDDVVVIGYGETTRKDLTGTVVSIKEEEIQRTQPVSFEQALVANAPGVRVVSSEGGPGAGLKVQVRGNTSILASSDPLYVIDGFPIISNSGNNIGVNSNIQGFGGQQSTSPLSNLDPADIKSIEVLKDASSTAVYGALGANGVVLITTKDGGKGKSTLTYASTVGIQRVARQVSLLGAQEYIDLYNEVVPFAPDLAFTNNAEPNAFFAYRDEFGNPLSLDDSRLRPIDFRDLTFRDAIIQKHNLSLSGGSDKSRYFASFGYLDQEGVLKNSEFVRYSTNFKADSNINDKLKVGFNSNIGYSKRSGVPTSSFGSNDINNATNGVITSVLTARPVRPNEERLIKNAVKGSIVRDSRTGIITEFLNRRGTVARPANPLNIVDNIENFSEVITARAGAFAEYKFAKNLSFKTDLSGRFFSSKGQANISAEVPFARLIKGRASVNQQQSISFVMNNRLSYSTKFDSAKHRFNAALIQSLQKSQREGLTARTESFFSPNVNLGDLNRSAGNREIGSSFQNNSLESYTSRLNYIYGNKYFLTLTGRADGSSRFLEGSQWGFFPSGALKWTVTQEEFLKNNSVINDLSFKFSIGLTGNSRIPFGVARGVREFDEADSPGTVPRVDNSNLTWETTRQSDFGIEGSLLNRRLRFSANLFDKTTTDLLFFRPTSAAEGRVVNILGQQQPENGFYSNLGKISNKGFELSVGGDVIKSKSFTWTVDANITFSENLIEELEVEDNRLPFNSRFEPRLNDEFLLAEGEELGSFYGYQYDGVYGYQDFVEFNGLTEEESIRLFRFGSPELDRQTRESTNARRGEESRNQFTLKPGVARIKGSAHSRPGLAKYKDLDGDGLVDQDNDRKVIGSSQADHFGGFTNTFKYKSFDMSFQFNWSYGNEILNLNLNRNNSIVGGALNNNLITLVRNRWRPGNTETNVPSLTARRDLASLINFPDSSLLEDGSYLRLGNISVSYRLPKNIVKSIGLNSFKVFGAVDNVYVWSNYSGFDPDVSVGNNPATPGTDFDAYPRARTFRMGVSAQF